MKPIVIIKKASEATKPLNLRQQKVVSLMSENVGKSKAEILRKAGYARSVVDNPDHVFGSDSIKPQVDDFVERMRHQREVILDLMEKKVYTASYGVLSLTLRNLNRDIDLFSGRSAKPEENEIDPERKAMFDELLRNHS